MKKSEFFTLLKKVPKAELHVHLEAVISMNTVKKLYKKRFGVAMPKEEQNSLFEYDDLKGFIGAFLKVQDLFTEVSDFDLVFSDFEKYLVENNIVYTEAFFAPSAFLKKGFAYKDMVENFSKNIKRIKKEQKITIKLLVDVSRTFGTENAQANYDIFRAVPCADIIGIGLGGDEVKGPCKLFKTVFDQAHKEGYHAVAHAGEAVGPESVWDAVDILSSERIGHGITSIQDEKLIEHLIEKNIPLEVCPTSNVFTKQYVKCMEEHPVRQLFDKGVKVTIGSDDPVFFKTTLLEEYWNLYSKLNFKIAEIQQLLCNSFTSSFLDDKKKVSFVSKVKKAVKDNLVLQPELF
ncbi:MAG: adenosine deaminase [Treponema sp.]|nr:adenosine deaminase [Treponema sp.]